MALHRDIPPGFVSQMAIRSSLRSGAALLPSGDTMIVARFVEHLSGSRSVLKTGDWKEVVSKSKPESRRANGVARRASAPPPCRDESVVSRCQSGRSTTTRRSEAVAGAV
jgi:hypothetical protein